MGERNTISSSFVVNVVEDGVVYEITSGISSVTVPSDGVTTTLATTLYFWKRVGGGERTAYSCYATLFRKNGNSLYAYSQSSGKVTSWVINQGVPSSSYDAVVVCIYDAASTAHSGYLAELVIPVIKNGDTGDNGQDAATLVFEPDTVYVPCDADGSVTDTFSQTSNIRIVIKGTSYAPDANSAQDEVIADYVNTAWGTSRQSITVSVNGGTEDFEGYVKVTATKTLNGVTYTASGLLPVVALKKGEDGLRGKTGPMSYLAGEYDATVNYGALLTDTGCPVVHYNATDEYWYPTEDYMGAGYPPSVANGWKKANDFEMVVTKILFTQFAKLGGFVVSGDYMFSQYGELFDADGNKLTLTQSTDSDGSTHWRYSGVDAYTYFRDYDPMVTGYTPDPPLAVLHRNGANGSTKASASSWADWSVIGKTTVYSKADFGNDQARANAIAVGDYFAIVGVDTSGGDHRIVFQCTENSTYLSGKALYFDSEAEGQPMYYERRFRPVKVVNAATGEEWMSSGKVHVGADGGVTVEGTIKAKNLYRNLCLFSGGVYSTEVFYISSLNDWSRTKGYAVGDYIIGRPDANVEPDFSSDGMVLCTYDADIIQMVPTSNNSWDSSNPLRLPAPKDFPGKVVEITGWSRTTSEVNMYVGSVMGSVSSMCLAVEVSGGKFVPAETATVIAIKTGTTTRFMSMILNGNYYWTKLNEK